MNDEFDVNDMSDDCFNVSDYDEDEEHEERDDLPYCGYHGRACGYCRRCLE